MLAVLPLLSFLCTFIFSGVYFFYQGYETPFMQISPVIIVLPALIIGISIPNGTFKEKINWLIDGFSNNHIITMCIIFLLTGAFSNVAKQTGCMDSAIGCLMSILSNKTFFIGLFFISAIIATAMGTSMGVVAVITPIALGFFTELDNLSISSFTVATIIGGAMFGDNLSMISDTTIAAIQTTGASPLKKFQLNAKIALFAAAVTIVIIYFYAPTIEYTELKQINVYSYIHLTPYIIIVGLAFSGMHIFPILIIGIIYAASLGFLLPEYIKPNTYNILQLSKDIYDGYLNNIEIMLLSIFIGGMSELFKKQGGMDFIFNKLQKLVQKLNSRSKYDSTFASILIAKLVVVCNIFFANNTITILVAGPIAKKLSHQYNIKNHVVACIIDIFACIVQGVLPYSPQILLGASLAGISPLDIIPSVIYCFVLLISALGYICFRETLKQK